MVRSLMARRDVWRRAGVERLTEPLHLNLIAAGVALFGGVRSKTAFDLLVRRHYAYGLLKAADEAKERGIGRLTAVELGVGAGAGFSNLCKLAEGVTEETGVEFHLVGFDSGEGMPPPSDYRDHPELYKEGWFPMDRDALTQLAAVERGGRIGPVAETIVPFVAEELGPDAPLGFAALDVDFYSSSKDALRLFDGQADAYLRSSRSMSTTSPFRPTRATPASCSRCASSTTSTSCASSTGTGTSAIPGSSSRPSG